MLEPPDRPAMRSAPGFALAPVVAIVAIVAIAVGVFVAVRSPAPPQAWSIAVSGEVLAAPGFDADRVAFCTEGGEVVAARLDSGELLWRRAGLKAFRTPVFAGGRIVVPTLDETLVGLDPETGSSAWTHPLGGLVSMLVPCGDELVVARGYGFRVVDPVNGEELWRYEATEDSEDHEGTEAITVVDRVAYVAFRVRSNYELSFGDRALVAGGVYAVDLDSRTRVWTSAEGARVEHAPVVVDDYVVAATSSGLINTVYAYGRRDGRVRWKHSGVEGRPVVTDGIVCFEATSTKPSQRTHLPVLETASFYCGLSLVDGSEKWKHGADPDVRVAGAHRGLAFYALGSSVEAVRAASGRGAWTLHLGAPPTAPLVVAGNRLLLCCGGADGSVSGFRLD